MHYRSTNSLNLTTWRHLTCHLSAVPATSKESGEGFFRYRPQCYPPLPTAGLSPYRSPERPIPAPECKKPNRDGWAKCKKRYEKRWLPDLGSNQGPADYVDARLTP